jgi:voltage-gated potassium channel
MLTVLIAIITITICAVFVLQVESRSDNPNIVTGEDAIWWAFVTVTTVGFGDRYPTTTLGRIFGIVLMSLGVGIFGVLTSFLAHFFLSGETEIEDSDQDEEVTEIVALRSEISQLRNESAQMQEQLQKLVAMLQDGKKPDHPS